MRPGGGRARRKYRDEQACHADDDLLHVASPHLVLAGCALAGLAFFGGGFIPGASVASGRANAIRPAAAALAEAKASAGTAASSCQLDSSSTCRSRARSLR